MFGLSAAAIDQSHQAPSAMATLGYTLKGLLHPTNLLMRSNDDITAMRLPPILSMSLQVLRFC